MHRLPQGLPKFPGCSPLAPIALLCALLAACGGDGGTLPAEGRMLEPLPEAPSLQVAPEAVPGAEGSLAVVVARPRGAAPHGAAPALTFSKPMVALGDPREKVPATLDPAVPGTWRWLGSASAEFVPERSIPLGTAFRVTVPAGLQALDGTATAEPYVWEFRTAAPGVVSIEPAPGDRWLGEEPAFRVTFDQAVRDLAAHAHLEVEGKGKVALRVAAEDRIPVEASPSWAPHATIAREKAQYALVPESKLPLDRAVTLVIDRGLRGVEGPLGTEAGERGDYRTRGPLRVSAVDGCVWKSDACPWGPLVLETTNLVATESLKGRLTIDPPVEVDWERVDARMPARWEQRTNPYVVIPARFRPGTRYAIRIGAGVEDVYGGKAPAFEGAYATDDRESYLDPGARLAVIESEGDGALPVQTLNRERLAVKLRRLSLPEMAVALRTWEAPKGKPNLLFEVGVGGARNTVRWTPVDVRRVFEAGRRTGLFVATFDTPDRPELQAPHVVGQVTDFAVHAKLGSTGGVVWVTRLSTGASVEGAALSLYDWDGAVRWRGTTDPDGLARVPGLETVFGHAAGTPEWQARYAMVAAEIDGDVGVTSSRWDDGLGPWVFGLRQDWDGRSPTSLGLLFPERGIYRPGETVHLKGLLRSRALGEIRTPPAETELKLSVIGPTGDPMSERQVRTSAFGTFDADFEIPKDAPLGAFQVRAEGALDGKPVSVGGSFRVEEYRAPQFRVDVGADEANVLAQEPMTGRVAARYLFGGAMADAKVRWNLVRRSETFQPPGIEGFTIGTRTWWWDDDEPIPATEVAGSGDGVTGPMGELSLDLGASLAPGEKSWSYVLEAEVEDVNRQRVAGRTSFTVHPAEWYAGVRVVNTGFAQVGRPLGLELAAVSPDGARAKGAPIHLEVKRREWKSIRKKGVGGQWFTMTEPEETLVHSCDVASAAEARTCSFEPDAPGFHVIEASVVDGKGRRQVTRDSVYVVGSGWVSWQRGDTDRLDLVADKMSYEPGETAKILVKSPFPEVEGILTVEREGISFARKVRLTGSAGVLEVPIDDSMVPNVFVSVLLARGRVDGGEDGADDPGRPAIRLGYTELKVEKKAKRLAVTVRPDSSSHRPREKVKVDLQVADAAGKGVPAELVVWAVDEGVLRLTGYEAPDPVEAVHPLRGLSVQLGEPLIHLVERRRYGDKGDNAGGGGGDGTGAGFRTDFKTTAIWLPRVRTDRAGKARVEFELPDNLTTFRVMAMAITEGDRFGVGRSEIQVAKPLLALPALPRLARVGDAFEAGVVVHAAQGTKPTQVKVSATAEGLALLDRDPKTTMVAPGGPREVRFRFEAKAPGEAILRFRVEGVGESDGVEQRLRVELPVAMEAVAIHGDTAGTKEEAIVPPGGIRPGYGGLELTFASTLLGGFDENMRQLVDYPYGCLEQQSSRLVPFVALRDLSSKYGVPWAGAEGYRSFIGDEALAARGSTDPDVVIADTVRAIERLQNHDGGYRYWSSSGCSAHFASAYAVLSLFRAKEVGYPVDPAGLARGQAFLSSEVAAGKCERCGWGCNGSDDTTRTFALWVLARTGAPLPSYYPELFGRREGLPLYARAMLSDAMFVGRGDRAQARKVLDELLAFAKESPQEVHFEEPADARRLDAWSSDTRTTAVVLQTLAAVAPEHPYVPKLARFLAGARGRDGRYRNTQEAAFALMALSDAARAREKEAPSFEAFASLGGTKGAQARDARAEAADLGAVGSAGARLAEARFEGRSMRVERTSVPIERLGSGGTLAFGKTGPGTLYYGALLRYAPAELPTTPLDRGLTVQRWFEPFGGGGQVRQLVAGELVRVKVRIATPQERRYAVVAVPIPAGLEVVDTSLASTAALPLEPSVDEWGEGEPLGAEDASPWARRFFDPFHHVERRDGKVVFFADLLPPGVHTASFVARATSPGDFVLQPAHAEEMYAPEVFGRSDGGRMKVVDHAGVAER